MAVHNTLEELFTGIADAIREKEGSAAVIVADDFPERVKNLATHDGEDALVSQLIGSYTNDRVTKIATHAFSNRNSLRSVSFENVSHIGAYAFYGCSKLNKVICPKLQKIGDHAFENVAIDGGISPLQITSRICSLVGHYAFSSAKISQFYMHSPIDSNDNFVIYVGAFEYSEITHLVIVSENGEICELYDLAIANTPIASGTGYIYVPRELVDSYKSAENWSTYASQFRALEDYTVDGTISGELDKSKI